MDVNESYISANFDLAHHDFKHNNFIELLKSSLYPDDTTSAKSVRFKFENYESTSNNFELNNCAIRSRITTIGYVRRADQLDISATEQDFTALALLLLLSLFQQQTITIHLNHRHSFIKKIVLEPIKFYQFDLNINHIDYSFNKLYDFIEELFNEKDQLEFLQTADENKADDESFNWNKDRNILLIRGDFFRIFNTASLLLNFVHPLNPIDELELTGPVGYREHLTGLSANINLWRPDSFGYFLDWENF